MRLNEREILILEYLKEHPRATTVQVRNALGINIDKTRRGLEALYGKGLVGRQPSLVPSTHGPHETLWTVGEPVKL